MMEEWNGVDYDPITCRSIDQVDKVDRFVREVGHFTVILTLRYLSTTFAVAFRTGSSMKIRVTASSESTVEGRAAQIQIQGSPGRRRISSTRTRSPRYIVL